MKSFRARGTSEHNDPNPWFATTKILLCLGMFYRNQVYPSMLAETCITWPRARHADRLWSWAVAGPCYRHWISAIQRLEHFCCAQGFRFILGGRYWRSTAFQSQVLFSFVGPILH